MAIVHGISYLQQKKLGHISIYSDSKIAIKRVQAKKAKTAFQRSPQTELLFERIQKAEQWLKNHRYQNSILKWDTENWGEIPADFGRK
ncbi:MAG: hypothetical protein GXP45_06795 [bacterium]|nr:hypothetical protein [bacterium]